MWKDFQRQSLSHVILNTQWSGWEVLFINFDLRNFIEDNRLVFFFLFLFVFYFFYLPEELNDVICEACVHALPPYFHLPIVNNPTGSTEECFTWHRLKSVSGETVVRETMKEGAHPGESQSHRWMDIQRRSLLFLRAYVHVYMLITMLFYLIMFWVAEIWLLSMNILRSNRLNSFHWLHSYFWKSAIQTPHSHSGSWRHHTGELSPKLMYIEKKMQFIWCLICFKPLQSTSLFSER